MQIIGCFSSLFLVCHILHDKLSAEQLIASSCHLKHKILIISILFVENIVMVCIWCPAFHPVEYYIVTKAYVVHHGVTACHLLLVEILYFCMMFVGSYLNATFYSYR